MSERTLKQLVGALVLVAGVWLIATFLGGGSGSIAASGEILDFFPGDDTESVETIRMDGPRGRMELTREGQRWVANGFESDTSAVRDLLDALGGTRIGDLAATNPANHDRMGVSADSAVALEIVVDGDTRTLLVGDQGSRFGTSYGRVPDQDEVYLLEGDIRIQLQRPVDDWRNKDIAVVDTALVARLEIERDGEAYTLVRADSAWTFEDGSEADANQARNVLTELTTVLAAGFLSEGDSLFAMARGGANVAYDADGNVLSSITVGSGDGERWARAEGDSITYRLSTFRVGRLVPTLESMRGGS